MKATATRREIEVTLTLNEEEALAIWAVTRAVGGSPGTTMRRVFTGTPGSLDKVLGSALRAAGVEPCRHAIHRSLSGSVMFDPLPMDDED